MSDLIARCPSCGRNKHPVSGNHFPHCGACPPPDPEADQRNRLLVATLIRQNGNAPAKAR